jgi:hypothetical protein
MYDMKQKRLTINGPTSWLRRDYKLANVTSQECIQNITGTCTKNIRREMATMTEIWNFYWQRKDLKKMALNTSNSNV